MATKLRIRRVDETTKGVKTITYFANDNKVVTCTVIKEGKDKGKTATWNKVGLKAILGDAFKEDAFKNSKDKAIRRKHIKALIGQFIVLEEREPRVGKKMRVKRAKKTWKVPLSEAKKLELGLAKEVKSIIINDEAEHYSAKRKGVTASTQTIVNGNVKGAVLVKTKKLGLGYIVKKDKDVYVTKGGVVTTSKLIVYLVGEDLKPIMEAGKQKKGLVTSFQVIDAVKELGK